LQRGPPAIDPYFDPDPPVKKLSTLNSTSGKLIEETPAVNLDDPYEQFIHTHSKKWCCYNALSMILFLTLGGSTFAI
jgi:hypothetical protein